jgi:hypothetical protein
MNTTIIAVESLFIEQKKKVAADLLHILKK